MIPHDSREELLLPLLLAMFQPRFLTLLAFLVLLDQPNIFEMSNIPGYVCYTNESTVDSSKCDSRTFGQIFCGHFWTIQAYSVCFHPKSTLNQIVNSRQL